jgi:hypothetical protein
VSKRLRVSASFSAKVPFDPSNTFNGNQDAAASYSIEEEVPDAMNDTQLAARLQALYGQLDKGVKLAVAASLDISFRDDNGVIRIDPVVVPNIPHTVPQQHSTAPVTQFQPRPQGGGGQRQQPRADLSKQPTVWLDYFDNGNLIQFYDCRSLKQAGVYKPRAADFRSVAKFQTPKGEDYLPLWMTAQDGSPVQRTAELLARAAQAVPDSAPF